MADERSLKRYYRELDAVFRGMPGVTLRTMSIRMAVREAVISLGDDAVGRAVARHARDGVPWKKALRDEGVDIAWLLYREKDADESFPWDE